MQCREFTKQLLFEIPVVFQAMYYIWPAAMPLTYLLNKLSKKWLSWVLKSQRSQKHAKARSSWSGGSILVTEDQISRTSAPASNSSPQEMRLVSQHIERWEIQTKALQVGLYQAEPAGLCLCHSLVTCKLLSLLSGTGMSDDVCSNEHVPTAILDRYSHYSRYMWVANLS